MVLQRSMLNWKRVGRGSICHRYMYIVLYIYRPAKFGVAVFQAFMFLRGRDLPVDMTRSAKCGVAVFMYLCSIEGGNVPWVYVHCAIYETYLCNGFAEIYAQLEKSGGGSICHRYMCNLLYKYRSAIRSAKFGVTVCKAFMLNWRKGGGSICHRYMCIVLYM